MSIKNCSHGRKNPWLRCLLYPVAGAHQVEDPAPEDFFLGKKHGAGFQLGEGDNSLPLVDPGVFQLWAAFTCSTHACISLSGVSVNT